MWFRERQVFLFPAEMNSDTDGAERLATLPEKHYFNLAAKINKLF
jgi:hypothetical protein